MKSSEFLNDVSHRQKNSLLELVGDKQLNNYLELSFSTIEKFIDSIPKDDDLVKYTPITNFDGTVSKSQ